MSNNQFPLILATTFIFTFSSAEASLIESSATDSDDSYIVKVDHLNNSENFDSDDEDMGDSVDDSFKNIADDSDHFNANFKDDSDSDHGTPAVPVPAAVWLFGSGLIGLVGIARRRQV